MPKQSRIFVGLLTVAVGTGCHAGAHASAPNLQQAPIYTDGPVPLPGQDFSVPQVMGTDGQPLVVPSILPGSLMKFSRPVARVPEQILIRRHSDGETDSGAAEEQVWTLEPVPLPAAKGSQSIVGFEVPQLPKGIYDVWYVGERPKSSVGELLEPGDPTASQWTTFEIRPQLRPGQSVVHGQRGEIVEVAIGIHGPASEGTSVTLSGFGAAVRLASGQRERVNIGPDGFARFKVRIVKESDVYLAATAQGFAPVAIRVVGGVDHPLRDHRLQPGDVLLCQGNSLISPAIQIAERMQLGQPNREGRPWYSHVALYLGGLGDEETAEMIDEGLDTRTLAETIAGCTTLDVYRRDGITREEQGAVVEKSKYGTVPYAWGQIAALGSMAIIANTDRVRLSGAESWWDRIVAGLKAVTARMIAWATRTVVTFVLDDDEGRSGMICSEFVAWSYHDADLRLDVAPWWPVVENAGLLGTLFGRMDFTTPNMIAQSPDLSFQFQLYPEVPVEVEVAKCQIRLGEKIEFETGSAVISENDEDLLEAVADMLANTPTIERLRIEGNTDDVGTAENNLRLSQERAEAVMAWFVAHGVDRARLSSAGLGETIPLMPNDSAAHRHQNRRVDFRVESQDCPD